jgi:GDP-4-dehydro-6-deoxy-D-mannose reductase
MNIAIVTGAGGFIGSHVVDMLLEKGWKVIATMKPNQITRNLDHLKDGQNPNCIIREVDMRDRQWVEATVKEFSPNAIFHLAAQSLVKPSWEDPEYTISTNMNGTINIFESIKKYNLKTKVIIACSSAAYGTSYPEELPLKETNPIRALHPYGISKIGQELLGRQYFINFGIESVMLRLFNQTGPRKVNDACSDFALKIGRIEAGKMKPEIEVGNLDTARDITGIRDTMQGIWLAYEKGRPGETYNLCSNKPTKIRDVLNYLLSLSSKKIKVIENTPNMLRITDEPIILGDNSKIKTELGYQPTQAIHDVLKEMFEDWVAYFSNHDDYIFTA